MSDANVSSEVVNGNLVFRDKVNTDIFTLDGANGKVTGLGIITAPGAATYKLARGQHTTVAASDTVVTGLTTVVAAMASLDSDPSDNVYLVSASIGDQAGTPAAGSILIKSWAGASASDYTPTAAGTFSKLVNWIAVGT
jgi:hypothetical protein